MISGNALSRGTTGVGRPAFRAKTSEAACLRDTPALADTRQPQYAYCAELAPVEQNASGIGADAGSQQEVSNQLSNDPN